MKKTALAMLLCSPWAHSSGLLLQEAVTANAGTGGAGDGVYTQTATANWTNPATMSHMGEQLTTINTLLFNLQMDYYDESPSSDTGEHTGNADAQTIMPSIGIFHVMQLNEEVHLGLNFGAVGGSSIEYGTNWDAANHLDRAFMSAMQFNPNVSFAITEHFSFGFGAQVNYGLIEVSTSSFETEMGSDWAYGYNFGAMYQEQNWALGVSYRSKLVHEFDVDAQTIQAANLGPTISLPTSTPFEVGTELVVPTIIDLSGSYSITSEIDLLASIQYHRWSEFNETPVYNDTLNQLEVLGVPQAIDRDWQDVWKFAIGTDYQLNADWALKAGFSYETSPQDDPTKQWVDLPVGEQYRYSLGASTYWKKSRIDLFYEYADFGEMDIEREPLAQISGTFSGNIHFIGANVTF